MNASKVAFGYGRNPARNLKHQVPSNIKENQMKSKKLFAVVLGLVVVLALWLPVVAQDTTQSTTTTTTQAPAPPPQTQSTTTTMTPATPAQTQTTQTGESTTKYKHHHKKVTKENQSTTTTSTPSQPGQSQTTTTTTPPNR
jgi:hypothetical protein